MNDASTSSTRDDEPISERRPLEAGKRNGPFFVVANVASGSGGEARLERLREHFRSSGAVVRWVPAAKERDLEQPLLWAVKAAREAGGTLVVVGGDGSINAALPLALESGVPLGIIPAGTFNYVARDFGISLDPREAVDTLVNGTPIAVRVGQVNGHPFLVNASLGLYPRLLEDREKAKRRYGRNRALALATSALSLLARRASTFSLTIQRASDEGESVGAPHHMEIATLFIGRSSVQLRRVGIEETEEPDELTAVALRRPSPLRLLGLGVRATLGVLGGAPDILTFPFEKLVVEESARPGETVKIALDGEVLRLSCPLIFEVAPEPLRLIVPDRTESAAASQES